MAVQFYICGTHSEDGDPLAFAVWVVGQERIEVEESAERFGMQYIESLSRRMHYAAKEIVMSNNDSGMTCLYDLLNPLIQGNISFEWLADLRPGSPHPGHVNAFASLEEALKSCQKQLGNCSL